MAEQYGVARRFVPAASTTAGILWALRNPTTSARLIVVKRVLLRLTHIATPSAPIEDQFTLKIARAYTLADTTGSVSIAPAAAMQKVRTDMADATAELRESSVAGGASGGTKVVDTDPIITGSVMIPALPAATGDPKVVFDYYPDVADREHPAVLEADEGLLIRNENSFGVASGIILHALLHWGEQDAYRE